MKLFVLKSYLSFMSTFLAVLEYQDSNRITKCEVFDLILLNKEKLIETLLENVNPIKIRREKF